ncbi:hypothetical protein [Pseudomonas aeruginosa]|uniref:hypothetical protein n=1 Tax=Pseudomonas aeruginosa TaxID=287 RepID=UPI00053E7447|nr:hypothetical protein [Pseudomonas aeruginosa]MBH3596332.1 hypothetical protein [Pseudomonas aeruginosa]MBH3651359.1 hypothetical protein [Pseudomonas aeruginosa]MBH3699717.1 hypothetical protein [Pseudomonas aeruginosa]MBH3798039.1 hypothetical protein [Pseudomonas aeruginosa]MBH8254527.1 hypothetical protein [Pseudomonas aeruginosa]
MALSDERRGIGARNEAIRRAGGQRVEAERRGDQGLTAALNRLIEPERQARALRKIDPRGALDAKRGRADYNPAGKQLGGGGGIASPLIEEDAAHREYYELQTIPTSDGLAWLRYRSVKKIVMTDASGAEVVMEYANDVSQ